MLEKSGLIFSAILMLTACPHEASDTTKEEKISEVEAQACIRIETDPDSPVLGGMDVKRLTNTCSTALNVAFCAEPGRPDCSAPEQPNLSQDEWSRAFLEQDSNGEVAYKACVPEKSVRSFTEGTWQCECPEGTKTRDC